MLKQTMQLVLFSMIFALAACGSDSNDDQEVSIDGTWQVTSLTCDGTEAQIPGMVLNVQDDVGSFVLTFGPGCVADIAENYSYSGTTLSISPTGIACDPNTDCNAVFGADCLPVPGPTDFTYERTGNTLTFTKTSGGPPADNCPAGTEEFYTMQLQ